MIDLPFKVNAAISGVFASLLLPNLLSVYHPDVFQNISLICIGIAYPFLGAYVMLLYIVKVSISNQEVRVDAPFYWLQYIGLIASAVGIGTDVMHTSLIPGIVFLVAIVVALVIMAITIPHINRSLLLSNLKINQSPLQGVRKGD